MNIDTTLAGWSSRTEVLRRRIDGLAVEALAATLDVPANSAEGSFLPAGWHWLFFNPVVRRSSLGEDGHPRRDSANSFLPPVALPRRMWAGSRIRYLAGLPIEAAATRTSRILNITNKEGRAGRLCFVTAEHRISIEKAGLPVNCVIEEQDIVYREALDTSSKPSIVEPAPEVPVQWQERTTPDTTLLFRYSALTFNGHRIHYDQPYASNVEGYRNLVVHGPLTATLLQKFARDCKPDSRLARFEFKGMNPLFVNEALELQAWMDEDDHSQLNMRVLDQSGALAMKATAYLEQV
jgi:3-methylfumaryl-CoA hydratase